MTKKGFVFFMAWACLCGSLMMGCKTIRLQDRLGSTMSKEMEYLMAGYFGNTDRKDQVTKQLLDMELQKRQPKKAIDDLSLDELGTLKARLQEPLTIKTSSALSSTVLTGVSPKDVEGFKSWVRSKSKKSLDPVSNSVPWKQLLDKVDRRISDIERTYGAGIRKAEGLLVQSVAARKKNNYPSARSLAIEARKAFDEAAKVRPDAEEAKAGRLKAVNEEYTAQVLEGARLIRAETLRDLDQLATQYHTDANRAENLSKEAGRLADEGRIRVENLRRSLTNRDDLTQARELTTTELDAIDVDLEDARAHGWAEEYWGHCQQEKFWDAHTLLVRHIEDLKKIQHPQARAMQTRMHKRLGTEAMAQLANAIHYYRNEGDNRAAEQQFGIGLLNFRLAEEMSTWSQAAAFTLSADAQDALAITRESRENCQAKLAESMRRLLFIGDYIGSGTEGSSAQEHIRKACEAKIKKVGSDHVRDVWGIDMGTNPDDLNESKDYQISGSVSEISHEVKDLGEINREIFVRPFRINKIENDGSKGISKDIKTIYEYEQVMWQRIEKKTEAWAGVEMLTTIRHASKEEKIEIKKLFQGESIPLPTVIASDTPKESFQLEVVEVEISSPSYYREKYSAKKLELEPLPRSVTPTLPPQSHARQALRDYATDETLKALFAELEAYPMRELVAPAVHESSPQLAADFWGRSLEYFYQSTRDPLAPNNWYVERQTMQERTTRRLGSLWTSDEAGVMTASKSLWENAVKALMKLPPAG